VVVYPPHKEQEPRLHVQLCGIWGTGDPPSLIQQVPEIEQKLDYFSIQAEISSRISNRMGNGEDSAVATKEQSRSHSLNSLGLPELSKLLSLQVQRKGSSLVIQSGENSVSR